LDRFGLAGGIRINDGQLLAEAQPRTHERVELSAGLKHVKPADSAQDALLHPALLAKAFDQLQIGIRARAFDAKIHAVVLFPDLYLISDQ